MKKIFLISLKVMIAALTAVLALWAIRHFAITLCYPYPVDYGEGVVINWIRRVATGLYPPLTDVPPYLHNPYTPLFYWIVSLFQASSGNIFLSGRFVNFISYLACVTVILLVIRRRTSWAGGLTAALLFAFSPIVLKYACMVRVDMTALAFALLPLLVLDRSRSKFSGVIAGVFCACAFLVKPTYIIAAIASSLACADKERRQFLALATAGVVTILLAFAIVFMQSGSNVLVHLLFLNRLPSDFTHFWSMLARVAGIHPFLICGIVMFLANKPDRSNPVWWYALLAPLGILLSLKTGAEENYYLELLAMGAIACGLSLRYAASEARPVLIACLAAQLVLYQPIQPVPVFTKVYGQEMVGTGYSLTPTQEDRQMGEMIMAEVTNAQGNVLCEDLGYLVAAGKNSLVEPYQFAHLARLNRWSDAAIVGMIERGEFSLIILGADPANGDTTYFTTATLNAVQNSYTLKRIIGRYHLYETTNN